MKTRREFFKTLAGSAAVLAACVLAPGSLTTTKNSEFVRPWKIRGLKEDGTPNIEYLDSLPVERVTSGYAQIGDHDDNKGTVTATSTNGNNTWQIVEWTNKNGWRSYEGGKNGRPS